MSLPATVPWGVLACVAGATVLVTGWLYRDEALLSLRIILQFLLTIALPLLALLAVPIWAAGQLIDWEPRIWQALIAGVMIATGWLTTTIFAERTRQRDKAERTRDVHKALYAEIGNTLYNLQDGEGAGQATLQRMRDDPGFVPFIPRESNDRIFDATLEHIEVLPRQSIDLVVSYYSLINGISALAEDMRGERFNSDAFSQDRRIAIYGDYLQMRVQAHETGLACLRVINAYATGGTEAAKAALAGINSPGADRSGRSRGSE